MKQKGFYVSQRYVMSFSKQIRKQPGLAALPYHLATAWHSGSSEHHAMTALQLSQTFPGSAYNFSSTQGEHYRASGKAAANSSWMTLGKFGAVLPVLKAGAQTSKRVWCLLRLSPWSTGTEAATLMCYTRLQTHLTLLLCFFWEAKGI